MQVNRDMEVGVSTLHEQAIAAQSRAENDGEGLLPGEQSGVFPSPSLAWVKHAYIRRVLAECRGNVSEAARRLGLHRRSLQRMLQRPAPNA
jgi:ActR/RegA family two-component response regulator